MSLGSDTESVKHYIMEYYRLSLKAGFFMKLVVLFTWVSAWIYELKFNGRLQIMSLGSDTPTESVKHHRLRLEAGFFMQLLCHICINCLAWFTKFQLNHRIL